MRSVPEAARPSPETRPSAATPDDGSSRARSSLIVLAKAPVAGRSKTRLTPPCTPEEAATLAEAALTDTLEAVLRTPARDHVLVLAGDPGDWLPEGFRVFPQRGGGLDERIAAAFDDAGGPALLIGMDTPQVTPAQLSEALECLDTPGVDAVLGPAADGGWWALGLRVPDATAILNVPMSTDATCAAQWDRLASLGLRVRELPEARDVDGIDDVVAVARMRPGSRFARAAATLPRAPFRGPVITGSVLAGVTLLLVLANQGAEYVRHSGVQLKVFAPPLVGRFDVRWSPRIAAAVAVGAAVAWSGPTLGARLGWRRLLWLSFGAASVWAIALAWHQGSSGVVGPPSGFGEYIHDVRSVGSPGSFLAGFVDRIDLYAAHVRAHPPGYVLVLWMFDRLGLDGPAWVGMFQILTGAAAVPATLVAAREVAGEHAARLAAPFLMVAPAAVFLGSGDAFFLGIGTWAVALLVLATGRRDRIGDVQALTGGLLFGAGLFLSYGFVLLAAIPTAVAVARRRARPLLLASASVGLVMTAFASAGFWWFAGLRASRREYLESIARVRPAWLFVWANIAAFAVALGPASWIGLARLRDRSLWLLVGGAAIAVALADLSLMSKGEVERIWLPFAPWFLLAAAALGVRRTRRVWIAAQAGFGVAIQLWVVSPW